MYRVFLIRSLAYSAIVPSFLFPLCILSNPVCMEAAKMSNCCSAFYLPPTTTHSLANIRPPFAVFPAPAPNITNHITFAIFSFTFARSKSSTCVTDAWEMVKLSYRQAKSHNIDGISPLGIDRETKK